MGAQHSGDDGEARRVSTIFGVLAFAPMLLIGALIDLLLMVTTGQDSRALLLGLIPATALAAACGMLVARHTRASLLESQVA
jgi:hypothetical protein